MLLFKELCKPLSKELKEYCVRHPRVRVATVSIGRTWDSMTQRIEIAFRGHHVKSLKEVPEAHALTVGADLISQGFLISVAIGLLWLEYYRSEKAKRAEAAVKKAEKQARRSAKEQRLAELEERIAVLEAFARHLDDEEKHSGAGALLRSALAAVPFMRHKKEGASAEAVAGSNGHDSKATHAVSGGGGEAAGRDQGSTHASAGSAASSAAAAAAAGASSSSKAATSAEAAARDAALLDVPLDTFDSILAPEAASEAAAAARRTAVLRAAERAELDSEAADLAASHAAEARDAPTSLSDGAAGNAASAASGPSPSAVASFAAVLSSLLSAAQPGATAAGASSIGATGEKAELQTADSVVPSQALMAAGSSVDATCGTADGPATGAASGPLQPVSTATAAVQQPAAIPAAAPCVAAAAAAEAAAASDSALGWLWGKLK